jgi:hypothetical protein
MTVEAQINTLIKELNNNGRNVPTEIWDLQDDLGYQLFDDFIEDVSSEKIRLLRHSREMNSSLFSMLANPKEKVVGGIGQFLFWLGLPFSVVLVLFYGWWFLLVAPAAYFLGSKLISSSYNSAIFNTAKNYESGFCFLYYIGQISVGNPENYKIAFYVGD